MNYSKGDFQGRSFADLGRLGDTFAAARDREIQSHPYTRMKKQTEDTRYINETHNPDVDKLNIMDLNPKFITQILHGYYACVINV